MSMFVIGAVPGRPEPWWTDIPADTKSRRPCVTRESFIREAPSFYAKGYRNLTPKALNELITRDLRLTRYDNMNCMIRVDMSNVGKDPHGTRAEDRVGGGQPAYWKCSTPCVGPTTIYLPEGRGWLNYVIQVIGPKALPILVRMIPVFGNVISEAIAPLVAEAIAYMTEEVVVQIAEEIEFIVNLLSKAVQEFWEWLDDPYIQDQVKKSFASLGVSSKTLVDAIKPAVVDKFDPRSLLGYVSSREGLGFAQHVISGDIPSLRMLRMMSIDTCMRISNYATAKAWLDSKKALASMQESIVFTTDKRGEMTAVKLRAFIGENMPNPDEFVGPRPKEMKGLPLELANRMVDRFSGHSENVVINPTILATLIPMPEQRARYLSDMSNVMRFDAAIVAVIRSVEQELGSSLDIIGGEMRALNVRYPNYPAYEMMPSSEANSLRAVRDDIRARVFAAYDRADQSIATAAESLRMQLIPDYAAKKNAVKNRIAAATAMGCRYGRNHLFCPPGVIAPKWAFERGIA